MYHTIVTLKKGEGRTIKSGGAWIYDNEIDTITGRFHNGDMVTVMTLTVIPWEMVSSTRIPRSASA